MRELRIPIEQPGVTSTRENNRRTGSSFEQKAADYLIENGYRILEKNYRIRTGEIDLIAESEREIVFCEVKYRRSAPAAAALSAVDLRKQRKIIRTAQYYLMKHPAYSSRSIRFDVIGITGTGHITHIQNAFEQSW